MQVMPLDFLQSVKPFLGQALKWWMQWLTPKLKTRPEATGYENESYEKHALLLAKRLKQNQELKLRKCSVNFVIT